ncbi:uncharacterized protein Z519_02164 [Cladophialophora bantiana CBS 173.52]|uniref:Uncharacterized protein n=1 Tax=Cladophialophora bantiana (strain ATCC 10958 / CBS 173.52 / CDC B-1940 / NIH 8579) TaxID=1442370 RepID=A0A0D2HTJ5_CLAB1|nr:uncharacterized protein Z519_02164 [Cladophialophora bantiana CBS 173.52]KIW96773.1 hypothetical protein Z519_02164 [Cladophialophora bantiana CBS 173.52]
MARFIPDPTKFPRLKDQVMVITGGSSGIGAATVAFFAKHGAKVISGDITPASTDVENVQHVSTDVTSYSSLSNLFRLAFKTYGRVDIAISNAGLIEPGNIFDPSIDLQSVDEEPALNIVDVNVKAVIYFARIASVYLRQGAKPGDDKCLLLMSSVAGFTFTPGLYVYGATKHAVIGLMRALAPYALTTLGIRVNSICPWTTETGMVSQFLDKWRAGGFAVNSPEDIAQIYGALAVDAENNGKAVYVEGGRGWEIEEGLNRLGPQWLGPGPWDSLMRGQRFFSETESW